jgi:CRISPR-associated endonuclease Csn1
VEELSAATHDFGKSKKISFKALRKLIQLPDDASFEGIKVDDEKNDVTSRHGTSAEGTGTLYTLLAGAAWESLVKTPEKLDRIAEVISFRADVNNIRAGLEEIGLDPLVLDKLMAELQFSTFNQFTGAGHISSKACRNMLPHLAQGLVYSQAAEKCGYDHTASRERNAFDVGATGKSALKKILSNAVIDRSLVGSPIARKALIEAVKQVKAVVEVHGIPDAIHIELARDVGKGIDERREIERGIEKRNKEKDKLRDDFAALLNKSPTYDELLRFELWKQQNGKCVYSDDNISPCQLVATDNTVQVDHILPWSRFGDDSFNNKTLCTAKANQEKKGQTPFEWLGRDEARWDAYVARVNSLPSMKGFKRRNYKIKSAKDIEEKFRSRNLNDTRWTCRLLAECLKQLYAKDKRERKVFTRPGALTDRMRRGWGVQWIKKDDKGDRIPDDRHHALDAIITAATTESMMNVLTRAFQKEELMGSPRDFRALDQPWPGFREEAIAAVEKVFVSRAERHRARGEAHAATIRSVVEVDGDRRAYERKPICKLTIADLGRVKDPDRNAAVIESLRSWIEAGKPEATPPLSPKGDPISKVTLLSREKPDVIIRGGAVGRGDMARVDVFKRANKKGVWQYFLVPIYPHQIATLDAPPTKACAASTDESEWPEVTEIDQFMWSLTPMNYLEIETGKKEHFAGYYRGFDRATGAIIISNDRNSNDKTPGIGARTLKTFNKYSIDRLGQKHLVESELRTWRGKVCMSPNPQG